MMGLFFKSEREKWATALSPLHRRQGVGLPSLDEQSRLLYERGLPRNVLIPRFIPDRPPLNFWMRPEDVLRHRFLAGQLILGKMGNSFLGHLDDRPMVTIAGARSGKTSTVLIPNLCLYPGSCLVLDPKGELARETAMLRFMMGHKVVVLDPFGQSNVPSHSFNVLEELDRESPAIIDEVNAITRALIFDDGDSRSRHWIDSARNLLQGLILLTLLLPEGERNLVSVRMFLTLTHPRLLALPARKQKADEKPDDDFFAANRNAVEALLKLMANAGSRFGGILASVGNRFLATPPGERGSIFSTAAAQTDFLDSLMMRAISLHSDFDLSDLRGDGPMTIYLCLPVGHIATHYSWARMVIQMACTVLERMGTYPRDREPVLFMMEEFATLGPMEIMERAAAYFPAFGVKLWAVLQDITQLRRNYSSGWETFLGNAGLVQCFANGDQATLTYLSERLQNLAAPFELREIFSRQGGNQLLMFEGEPPIAAPRLSHDEVMGIKAAAMQAAGALHRMRRAT